MRRTFICVVEFILRILLFLFFFAAAFYFIKEIIEYSTSASSKTPARLEAKKEKVPFRPVLTFCEGLYEGDRQTLTLAHNYMRDNPRVGFDDRDYVEMTKNCAHFKKSRGYVLKPISEEERQFPIAFSVLAYQDAEQVERLLRSIYMPQNFYCIHYDARSPLNFRRALDSISDCFDNVIIASNIISVHWGTMSVLEADMNCMKDLLRISSTWRYFINLTGQEMALKSNRQLVRILKAYGGANDIEGTVKRRLHERYQYVHEGTVKTNRRKSPPPHNITIVKGAVHIVASRGFVDFCVHDRRAQDFYEWLRDTGVPDESFFSTINYNPQLGAPGAFTGVPETDRIRQPFLARFKNWQSGPDHVGPCHGLWVRGVCVLGIGDLFRLRSRRELFVNKLYQYLEYLALDCVEERLHNLTRDSDRHDFTFDTNYYENLPFVLLKRRD